MTRLLSIRQPWAGLIMSGEKEIENRSWSTSYRGRIGVHASTALAKGPGVPTVTSRMDRDRGHVLGTVRLVNVHEVGSLTCDRLDCPEDPFADMGALFHWDLTAPRVFVTPIHAKGALSLWTAGPTLEHLMSIADEVRA